MILNTCKIVLLALANAKLIRDHIRSGNYIQFAKFIDRYLYTVLAYVKLTGFLYAAVQLHFKFHGKNTSKSSDQFLQVSETGEAPAHAITLNVKRDTDCTVYN